MTDVFLRAALALADAGYSIFPVTPGEKKPPLVPWQPYQTQRASVHQVESWWAQWPSANIAIATGTVSGVNVLDLDVRSGAKLEEWNFPTPYVDTPSGGRHLYFRADVTSGSPVGILPGVDLRCNGAYVIAPPSQLRGGEVIPLEWQCAHLDALLNHEMLSWSAVLPRLKAPEAPAVEQEPWVSRALAEGAPVGEQRHTLTRLAGYFARRLPRDITIALLYSAAGRWDLGDPDVPWLEDDVVSIVDWAMKQAAEEPAPGTVRFTGGKEAPQEERLARYRSRILTAEQRATEPAAKIAWVAEQLVSRGALTELIAPPKLGKTTLMLSMVRAVLAGTPAFGVWATTPTKVLLMSEQAPAALTGSLERAGLHADSRLVIVTASDMYQVSWEEAVGVAIEEAAARECGLLVVDTVAWLAGVEDENQAPQARAALAPFGLALQAGIGVLLVRHSRKDDESLFTAGRGSSAWTGAMDVVAHLKADGTAGLRRLRTVGGLGESQDEILRYENGHYVRSEQSAKQIEKEQRGEDFTARVVSWLTPEWQTAAEIAEGRGMTREAVRMSIARHRSAADPEGEIVQIDTSRTGGYRYRLAPTVRMTEGD